MLTPDPSKSCKLKPSQTDLTGQNFGRLEVVSLAGKDSNYRLIWSCKCECGGEINAYGHNLLRGTTASCGCARSERAAKLTFSHGLSRSPEYNCWHAMIERCTRKSHPNYGRYGGRGIAVCDRWLNSLTDFVADVGRRPSRKHSLDRFPDPDGNYEPGNVRWATMKQQAANHSKTSNKRKRRLVKYQSQSLSIAEWARLFDMPYHVVHKRLSNGWSAEYALNTPVRNHR